MAHLVILLTAAVLIFGVSGGIEKINKVMMPAFFILFIIIAVRVAFLPNAIEGYKYLLTAVEYLHSTPRTRIGGDGSGVLLAVDHRLGHDHLRLLPAEK